MNSCRLCKNKKLEKIFDLGIIPLGYPIDKNRDSFKDIWKKKLEIKICPKCLLAQTVHLIPHNRLEIENHYHVVSKVLSDHSNKLYSLINSLVPYEKNPLICEIGCGDGSFLHTLQSHGFTNVLGIEPSIHSDIDYRFDVVADFFNKKIVQRLKKQKKFPDLIVASYVIEIIPNLNDFFQNLVDLMKVGSFTIIEVPYLNDLLRNFRIDSFAHLRCSYFNVNSLIFACKKYNLEIVDIWHDKKFRGGTIVIIVKKSAHPQKALKNNLLAWMKKEREELQTDYFKEFKKQVKERKEKIRKQLAFFIKAKRSVIGYGGGRKPSTLLNWLNLSSKEFKKIVDVDHNMHNKFIPIANIPIRTILDLPNKNGKAITMIILALDYTNEIISMLKKRIPRGSVIIVPLPKFTSIKVNSD